MQHRRRLLLAALASPFAAFGQQQRPVIGLLHTGTQTNRQHQIEAFRRGLKEAGFVDGKNVSLEIRWGDGDYDRLPEIVREFVSRKVSVIVAAGGSASAVAAKSVTSTIPIVFQGGADPVRVGLVSSLSKPGGNITGVLNIATSLEGKRLELLRDLVPGARRIAVLLNPKYADIAASLKQIQTAAASDGTKVEFIEASTDAQISAAFNAIKKMKANAVQVGTDAFFTSRAESIVALAARDAIPACYAFREFVMVGGLVSYGANLSDQFRQAGLYAARILKGAKPGDLPVIQAYTLELVMNLKTAKTLGLAVSRDFLSRVDEAIQ